jgi:hypothetical protein
VSLPIVNDNVVEPDEAFEVSCTTTDDRVNFMPSCTTANLTVNILNDDSKSPFYIKLKLR